MISQTHRLFGNAVLAALALTASLLPAIARAEGSGSYTCPVLHNSIDKVTKDTLHSDYLGVRYYYCCEACKPEFDKDQGKFLKDPKNKGKVVGASLFDAVTTTRIEPEKAVAHSDYGGVRYFFAKAEDRKAFDKEPKKYVVAPKSELLYCPVSDEIVDSYAEASDYSDYKGTRYYFCCAGCKPKFDKAPDRYLGGLDLRVKEAQRKKSTDAPVKDGAK